MIRRYNTGSGSYLRPPDKKQTHHGDAGDTKRLIAFTEDFFARFAFLQ
jgi:hypothetical protein